MLIEQCIEADNAKAPLSDELNMNKKSEYIIAKRNKSLAEHYKKWRNICDFN